MIRTACATTTTIVWLPRLFGERRAEELERRPGGRRGERGRGRLLPETRALVVERARTTCTLAACGKRSHVVGGRCGAARGTAKTHGPPWADLDRRVAAVVGASSATFSAAGESATEGMRS